MNWEQKLQACQALGDISLRMRAPGDWYVSHRAVEISDGHMLSAGCVNGAKTPEEAVNQHWEWLTTLNQNEAIILNAHTDNRRAYVWNGFMWQHKEESR